MYYGCMHSSQVADFKRNHPFLAMLGNDCSIKKKNIPVKCLLCESVNNAAKYSMNETGLFGKACTSTELCTVHTENIDIEKNKSGILEKAQMDLKGIMRTDQ